MHQNNNTKPENPSSRSFFDDDNDQNTPFDFVYPNQTHEKDLHTPAIIASTLSCQNPGLDYPTRGVYALHGRFLVLYRTKTANTAHVILELSHSRLQGLSPAEMNPNYGFRVTKNDTSFEFYSPNKQTVESWLKALKGVCVLTSFHEEYIKVQSLGQGSFAKVFLMKSKITNCMYAIKGFSKKAIISTDKEKAKPILLNEINIMRSLDHDHIIKLHEVHESDNSIYLVMELVKGKTLGEILKSASMGKKSLSDSKIKEMMRSIFDAFAYMESEGIMHRDLKPSNILVEGGEKIKVADFGLATRINLPQYIFKKCGTPGYLAPEVLVFDDKSRPSEIYDPRCDMFSAGCIFFFMLFGFPLFNSNNLDEIVEMTKRYDMEYKCLDIIRKEIKSPSSKMDKDALDLLLQLLDIDPTKRPTASQALEHPYFLLQSKSQIHSKRSVSTTISKTLISGYVSPNATKNGQIQLIFPSPEDSCESGAFLGPGANKFVEKNSLFLDLSKPGSNALSDENSNQSYSANNSVGVDNEKSETNSHLNTPRDRPRKTSRKLTPTKSEGNQYLKAAIHQSMQKQMSTDDEDSHTPRKKGKDSRKYDEDEDEIDDIGDEDPQVQQKFDQMQGMAHRKPPSNMVVNLEVITKNKPIISVKKTQKKF